MTRSARNLTVLALAPLLLAAAPATGWFAQASAAIDGGRLVEAAAILAQPAADRSPAELARLKARLFVAEGRATDALALFASPELAPQLDCADRTAWTKAAVEARSADAGAIAAASAAACPDAAAIWLALAVLADQAARWDEAAEHYARAAALAPDNPLVFVNQGYSLILQRRFAEADALIAGAAARWPDDVMLQNNWDLARGALGRAPELRRADSAQRRAERLNNAGYAALLAGDREAARTLLTRAIETGDRASRETLANWARAGGR